MKKIQISNKINYQIKAKEVRVVKFSPEQPEFICPFEEAMKTAKENGMELIQISADMEVPVCRIMELSKFAYDLKQKEKEKKKSQKGGSMKEIWLGPNISDHDLETKVKKAIEFLADGNKVNTIIEFSGRNNLFKDRGELVMVKFAKMVEEAGIPEYLPKTQGKRMQFIIKPLKNGKQNSRPTSVQS